MPGEATVPLSGTSKFSPKAAQQRALSVRALRWGQHLITAVLLLVALLRAASTAASSLWLAIA
ncbi:MAG TPA: hypothetical protein DCY59_04650, partial [Micrococcaceae bacterium]|nr:hypothetical protein [Micrococcaceae bacterium]